LKIKDPLIEKLYGCLKDIPISWKRMDKKEIRQIMMKEKYGS
jgi:hypothetical protein